MEVAFAAARPTPASRRRTAARRSPRLRGRSRTCGSGGSTRRRPRTSARSGAASRRNIVPERCTFIAEARSHDEREARRRRPGDARRVRLRRVPDRAARSRREVERGYKRLPLPQGGRAGAARARSARADGSRAVLRALRRRGRCERLQHARSRLPQPRERDGGDPHARRSTSPSPTSRRWSTSRSRSWTRPVPLSLARGRRHRGARAARGARAHRGRRERMRRVSAADRPCRARRRGDRQHAGARARARLRAGSTSCTRT